MMSEPKKGKESGRPKLVSGPITHHLIQQTWPLVVGVAAIMSVGLVDAYFVGRLGPAPLAAVSFIFPVTTALSSLGVGVMVGIASVVSRALGRGDHERAAALANLGFVVAIAVGIFIGGGLYLFRLPLFSLLRAKHELLPLIDAYMGPYALGFFIQLAMMGFNGSLRAQGAANRSMAILVAYAVANWVLDPILINGTFGIFSGYGIAGAAYATVASFGIATVLAIALLQTSGLGISASALSRSRLWTDLRALMRVGGPAAVANAINPIGLAILTALLSGVGRDAVAGYGAASRIESFAVVPLLGLSGSIGAIVGQNFGADRQDRVRRALGLSLAFSIAYGFGIAAVLVACRHLLSGMFSDNGGVRTEFSRYLLIAVWGYGCFGVFIVVNGALNAVDRAGLAFAQSLVRVLAIMVPVAVLLQNAFGSSGVYGAELASNLLGAAIAMAAAWFTFWRSG